MKFHSRCSFFTFKCSTPPNKMTPRSLHPTVLKHLDPLSKVRNTFVKRHFWQSVKLWTVKMVIFALEYCCCFSLSTAVKYTASYFRKMSLFEENQEARSERHERGVYRKRLKKCGPRLQVKVWWPIKQVLIYQKKIPFLSSLTSLV